MKQVVLDRQVLQLGMELKQFPMHMESLEFKWFMLVQTLHVVEVEHSRQFSIKQIAG